jgi:CBS domain-containing protein
MMTVRDLLTIKGRDVFSVRPDVSVFDALTVMAARNIGAVLVIDGNDTVGIFTERDYARHVVLEGRASRDTPVQDVMTSRVVYVVPDQDIEDCMALMTAKRCRHLPILEHGHVVGLLSIGDIVKALLSEKQFVITQLETYIMGERVRT